MENQKTVAFITRHIVANYGSVLQAYATQEAIKKLGCKSVCIDYFRTDELPRNLVATRLSTSKWNKNPLTRAVFMLTQKPVYSLADKRFEQYRKIVDVTETQYNSLSELENNLPPADVYMTGSDQVWNTVVCGDLDPAYFLSFVPGEKRKVAYAASFGGKLDEKQLDEIKPMLKEYNAISVREDSGVKLLEQMNINAEQVLDPTFLLDRTEWEKLIPDKKTDEKYALVYQLHPNREFDKYAKAYAKKHGLKLYRISHCFHHAVRSGKFVLCPPLGEFLSYIKNAQVLLTDSFHGTAFAIGLNTPFLDILPSSYSERISSILSLIGYENRILKNYNDFETAAEPIDFDRVNEIIAAQRIKSYGILKKMIGD
ncbi:MAG TPA: polysaccharide pyruvyl transferase family protein [Ruminococcaceae bacterium]|nr:polysaccharide pyruvyl transferase family protein [Oscillospiraceae bacterium]